MIFLKTSLIYSLFLCTLLFKCLKLKIAGDLGWRMFFNEQKCKIS